MKEPRPMHQGDFDNYTIQVRRNAKFYAQQQPGRDNPLSGEYADDLTPDGLLRDMGLDPYEVTAEDRDELADIFEEAYFAATPDTDTDKDTTP